MAMQTFTLTPVSSPGWVDDIDSTRGITFKRNNTGNYWQAFALPIMVPDGWQIVGTVVRCIAGTGKVPGLYDTTPTVGQVSRVWLGGLADTVALSPATYDNNPGTYYGDAVAQSTQDTVTVIHDLGVTKKIISINANYQNASGGSCEWAMHSSLDGVTWFLAAAGNGAGAYMQAATAQGLGMVARFWRFSVRCTSDGPYTLSINGFLLVGTDVSGGDPNSHLLINANGSVVGNSYMPSHVQCAWGTSTATIGSSLFTGDITGNATSQSLGSVSDAWGWTPTVVNQANYSLFVSRPTGASEQTANPRYVGSVVVDVYYNATAGGSIMAERTTVHQSSWIGKELQSAKGTPVATPTRLVSLNWQPQPSATIKELRGPGEKLPYDQALQAEWCTMPVEGYPTYNEMGYLLSSLIGAPASALIPGSSSASRHTFRLNTRADDPSNSFTVTYGDTVRAHQVTFAQILEMGLNYTRTDATLSGNGVAQRLNDSTPVPVGVNEVQSLTFTGIPTGGTFRLMFRGQETTDLQVITAGAPITAAALQTALLALPTVGAGNLTVSGALVGTSSVTGGALTISFTSALAGLNVPALVVSKNNLTGGTVPAPVVAITTQGGYSEAKPAPILSSQVSIYLSNSYATLASSKMLRIHVTDIKFSGKGKEFFTLNDAVTSFTGIAEEPMEIEVKLTAQADSAAMGVLGDLRAGNLKYLRVAASTTNAGVTIDGTNPFAFVFEMACKVASTFPFKDESGIYATEFSLKAKFDPTTGLAPTITLDNDFLSY